MSDVYERATRTNEKEEPWPAQYPSRRRPGQTRQKVAYGPRTSSRLIIPLTLELIRFVTDIPPAGPPSSAIVGEIRWLNQTNPTRLVAGLCRRLQDRVSNPTTTLCVFTDVVECGTSTNEREGTKKGIIWNGTCRTDVRIPVQWKTFDH